MLHATCRIRHGDNDLAGHSIAVNGVLRLARRTRADHARRESKRRRRMLTHSSLRRQSTNFARGVTGCLKTPHAACGELVCLETPARISRVSVTVEQRAYSAASLSVSHLVGTLMVLISRLSFPSPPCRSRAREGGGAWSRPPLGREPQVRESQRPWLQAVEGRCRDGPGAGATDGSSWSLGEIRMPSFGEADQAPRFVGVSKDVNEPVNRDVVNPSVAVSGVRC